MVPRRSVSNMAPLKVGRVLQPQGGGLRPQEVWTEPLLWRTNHPQAADSQQDGGHPAQCRPAHPAPWRPEVQCRLRPGAAHDQVLSWGSLIGWILMLVTVLCLPGRISQPSMREQSHCNLVRFPQMYYYPVRKGSVEESDALGIHRRVRRKLLGAVCPPGGWP